MDQQSKAVLKFYYPLYITGKEEDALRLWFFNGTKWLVALHADGSPAIKDTRDNQDGTASGGVILLVVSSTSTPKITDLTGTVFANGPDTLPPVLSGVPANIVAEVTSPGGAAVSWANPTVVDDSDGSLPVTCTSASGSTFPLSTTTVTCTASDGVGNTSSASFTVKVVDTTPPAVTASRTPGPNANGWSNTDVTVSASGTDSGSGIASCTTVVVSAGAAGQSATVSCTDKAGNTASSLAPASQPQHSAGNAFRASR